MASRQQAAAADLPPTKHSDLGPVVHADTGPTEFTPLDVELALINATQEELNALAAQHDAILRGIIRVHKLAGNWRWDGKKFLKL